MRVLVLAVVLAVLVLAAVSTVAGAYATLQGRRRTAIPAGAARWRAAHWSDKGVTKIGVERVVAHGRYEDVLERRLVASVRDDDPDYEVKFGEAMATARVRAEVLGAAD